MPDLTNPQVTDVYTRRALVLLRYANSLAGRAQLELTALGRQLRTLLLAADTPTGVRDLAALLRDADAFIQPSYSTIADNAATELRQLIEIEAAWAAQAGNAGSEASATAIQSAWSSMLVQGAPLAAQWQRAADDLSFRFGVLVRDVVMNTGDLIAAIRALGEGRALRGGLIEEAQRNARALATTATETAAYAGRIATFRASGVNALQWHSVLDNHTTLGCMIRAGKLYDLDLAPIGHDIPIERPPPRHWNCRSILVPMKFPDGPPADGGVARDTFASFLDRHTPEEQDAMLGKGRADLWRRGVITLSDLVGQQGEILTLGELRAL